MKQNCWEFKKCGRELGGNKVADLEVCPAATIKSLDGVHQGKNGGRSCWVVNRTYCNGEVQGTFFQKFLDCIECDFYDLLKREEGPNFVLSTVLLSKRNRQTF